MSEQDSLSTQQKFLERIASTYRRGSTQDEAMRRLCVRTLEPWLDEGDVGLEIGCSDGLMTEMLSERLRRLEVVEATECFLAEVRKRKIPNVVLHHTLIEEFRTEQKFDRVFATWILTHLIDVKAVLGRVREILTPGGLLFVVVPNGRVLSRQLALHMGLLGDLYELTENDRNHGHRRTYDRQRLNRELEAGGFDAISQGGLMLKVLADYQMDQLFERRVLNASHIEGFYKLGREYPDFASAIYSVCKAR